MIGIIIGIVVLVIILLFIIIMYNNFVNLNNMVEEAFSTMDIYLKKRWDLIPNLVECVKGYAEHEKNTLEEIVNLRNNVYDNMSNQEKVESDNKLSSRVSKLMLLAESYPELKANENFLKLSEQLVQVENDIENSRKYYNGTVKNYNISILKFPNNIVAKMFGYKQKNMFEAKEEEKQNVKVNL